MNSFWKKILNTYLVDMGYNEDVTLEDYTRMRLVFEDKGGSWQEIAAGGTASVSILKKVCKTFKKIQENKKDETK